MIRRSEAGSSLLGPRTTALVALAVVLTLSSTVVHASWTAAGSATTTASNGTIGVTTGGSIPTALNTTYSASSLTRTGPVTITNTGTTPLEVRQLAVSTATGSSRVPAASVSLAVWLTSGAVCGTSVPTSTLASGTLASGALTLTTAPTVAVGAARTLCLGTTLTGGFGAHVGKTVESTVTVVAGVPGSSQWVATDASARTFTQQVPLTAPVISCLNNGASYGFTLSWSSVQGASYVARWRTGTTGTWSAPVAVTSPQSFTNWSGGVEIGDGVRQIRIDTIHDGATVEGSPIAVRYESIFFFFTTPRCG